MHPNENNTYNTCRFNTHFEFNRFDSQNNARKQPHVRRELVSADDRLGFSVGVRDRTLTFVNQGVHR